MPAPRFYRRWVPLAHDLPAAQRDLLHRIERRTWLLVVGVCLAALVGHCLVAVLVQGLLAQLVSHGFVVVSAAVPSTVVLLRQAFARAERLVRQQAAWRAEQEHAARLDAALLVARTAAHRVNNALAPLAGYTQLLAQDPAIVADPRLTRYATAAQAGAQRVAAEIARLQQIVRLEADATVVVEPPVLDLDRSTAPRETPGRQPGV